MPKKPKTATHPPKKPKPLYRQKPRDVAAVCDRRHSAPSPNDLPAAKPIPPSHFELREDGTIQAQTADHTDHAKSESSSASSASSAGNTPRLIFSSDSPFVRLYHGNCLELLDAIHAKYGDAGRFDCIFADPPYFLSNGGITCHAGKMVKVDKGDWDKSRGPELNHEFNKEWLLRCQRVLKPNGTIWVSGTHHVIFSIGYAMQELGFKILNDIAWEKPNPPPNLSCRYFTHSTETILWAAKSEKSKHTFNYKAMKAVTGKQMKTVWRREEFEVGTVRRAVPDRVQRSESAVSHPSTPDPRPSLDPIWTLSAPRNDEKIHGKHPTQKPLALIERCILASTNEGEFVFDPFMGSGTTAVVSIRLNRNFIGIELDLAHATLAKTRTDREIIEIWLNHFQVRMTISVTGRAELPLRPNIREASPSHASNPAPSRHFPLDLFPDSINGSGAMDDKPQIPTERIFHETKFVFLSCAEVERGAVVHTTVDVSLQEAWAKTPTGKKRETTHIVRCETEIFRVRPE